MIRKSGLRVLSRSLFMRKNRSKAPVDNRLSPNISVYFLLAVPPYISYVTSWKNLLENQDISSLVIISFTLMTCEFDQVMILWGEVKCLSLLGLKGIIEIKTLPLSQMTSYLQQSDIKNILFSQQCWQRCCLWPSITLGVWGNCRWSHNNIEGFHAKGEIHQYFDIKIKDTRIPPTCPQFACTVDFVL